MSDVRSLPRWLVPAIAVAVAAPIGVAVLAQRNAHWHPVYDLAMTELRVRDVGGPHTPLIGLQGRIGPSGSHPGPISFYLLAPVYRLLGSSAFALQAATGVFNVLAAITALLVAGRRRDTRVVVGVGLVLLLLVQGYGLGPLTEPWNPHLPVLWFVAFLVAVWAVVDGDLPMLAPAVVAGSICAQTHVPYLAVTLGIGTVVAAFAALRLWRHRDEPGPRGGWWFGLAAALGLLLWTPPLLDEVVHEPGNLSQIVEHLGSPEEPIGIRQAGTFVLTRLDAWQLVVGETAHPGTYIRTLSGPGPSTARGTVTLAVWIACVGAAASLRDRRLLGLHGLVALGLAVAVGAISRIFGTPWPYLMLWSYGIGALLAVSIVATTIALLARRWPRLRHPDAVRIVSLTGLVLMAALSVRLLVVAPDATTETPAQTQQLARLVPSTVAAIEQGVGSATAGAGRYFVLWADATEGGSEGIGLVNELVRRGYDVGVDAGEGLKVGTARVWPPEEATARIVFASGRLIDHWAAEPGAVRVAYDDPRTPAERAESEEVHAQAIEALIATGRSDLVDQLDTNLFGLALGGDLDGRVDQLVGRLHDLGAPAAVFLLPGPGAS